MVANTLTEGPGTTAKIVTIAALGTNGTVPAVLATETRFFRTGMTVGYGNPDLTPRNQVGVEIAANPQSLLTGDFNGDGLRDAMVFSTGPTADAATAAFVRGNADGSFGAPVSTSLGGFILGATSIDLNKDGRLDVIACTQTNNPIASRLHVLLNQGGGSFGVTTIATALGCASPVAGDFNRDGNNDVIYSDSDRGLNIYAGNGDGTLRAPVRAELGFAVRSMAPADLNGDGNLDLAAASRTGSGLLAVLLGNGALGFPTQNRYAGSYYDEGLLVSDFDADGKLDLIQGTGEANAISFQRSLTMAVFFGRGDGTLDGAQGLRVPAGSNVEPIGADFTGDGRTDLLSVGSNSSTTLFAGTATGRLETVYTATLSGEFRNLTAAEAADFNGDGRADLVFTDSTLGLYVALNNGSGRFPAATRLDNTANFAHVAVGDFNGDGRLDLAAANNGGTSPAQAGNVAFFAGAGNGSFTRGAALTPGPKPSRVALRDLDGDNRAELVVVNRGLDEFAATTNSPGGIVVYAGNAGGTFTSPTAYTAGRNPGEISIGDLNGDGRPDVVAQVREGQFGDRIAVLLNVGGTLGTARLLNTAFGPRKPALADLNGDGNVDMVVAHCCGDTPLGYYLGLGGGNFSAESLVLTAVSYRGATAVDFDGDGRMDIVGVSGDFTSSESTLFLLRNASMRSGVASAVSAASFTGGRLAAGSIVSLFGTNLANGLVVNEEAVAPEELGGVTVTVRDFTGTERKAQLFFVSPGQVNALIPAEVASGPAAIAIRTAAGAAAGAVVEIRDFQPGLFAATATGLAAANVLRIAQDGTQTVEPVVEVNAAGQVVARPIDLGAATDQVFLLLYGTGIRGRGTAPTTTVMVGGQPQTVQYAGAQGQFIGLDQVNVRLNRNLAGRGLVDVVLTLNFQLQSNVLRVNIR